MLLDRELHRLGIEGLPYDQISRDLDFANTDDMLAAIGCGDIHLGRILQNIMARESEQVDLAPDLAVVSRPTEVASGEISILGVPGLLTSLARCCKPVPGDPIVGYVTRGRGATIHRQDCPNVLRVQDHERIVQVSWGQPKQTYPVSVRLRAYDRDGLMRDVSTLVSNEGISMSQVHVSTKNSLATFDLVMGITDVSQLSRVLNRLEALPNVLEARRLRPG